MRLSHVEFELLRTFVLNPGRVLATDFLLGRVWADDGEADADTVSLYVRYLGSYGWKLALGILFATPLPRRLFKPVKNTVLGTFILFAIFAAAIYCVSIGSNDPFMYFNF